MDSKGLNYSKFNHTVDTLPNKPQNVDISSTHPQHVRKAIPPENIALDSSSETSVDPPKQTEAEALEASVEMLLKDETPIPQELETATQQLLQQLSFEKNFHDLADKEDFEILANLSETFLKELPSINESKKTKETLIKLIISTLTTLIGYPSVQNMILTKGSPSLREALKNYQTILKETPFKGLSVYGKGAGIATLTHLFVGLTTKDTLEHWLEEKYPTTNPETRKKLAILIGAITATIISIMPATSSRNQRMALGQVLTQKQKVAGVIPALIRDLFMGLMQLSHNPIEKTIFGLTTIVPNTLSQNIANEKISGIKNPYRNIPEKIQTIVKQNPVKKPLNPTITSQALSKITHSSRLFAMASSVIGKTAFAGFWPRVIHLSISSIALATLNGLKKPSTPNETPPELPTPLPENTPLTERLRHNGETIEDYIESGNSPIKLNLNGFSIKKLFSKLPPLSSVKFSEAEDIKRPPKLKLNVPKHLDNRL